MHRIGSAGVFFKAMEHMNAMLPGRSQELKNMTISADTNQTGLVSFQLVLQTNEQIFSNFKLVFKILAEN